MTTTETTALSAGQLLRQAREQRKLSAADVALQLNLRVNLVQQIEADQLDSTMLPTFVRGYLRAYARLVKLPEKQVLTAFELQNGGSAGPAKPMRTFSNRAEIQATENRFMWVTYAMGFILVLMLVLWWWQTASPVASDDALQPRLVEQTPEQQQAEQQQAEPPQTRDEKPDNSTAVAHVQNEVPANGESDIPERASDAEPLSLPDFINPDTMPALVETSSVVAKDAVIAMVFADNCWIDVLDAAGNRIAYGTKQAGYSMTVTGKAPFVVTLGNPSVVKITINNQPFDMSSLPSGRVAKFTLAEPD
jgi:cytoskeleton protein RodZ